MGVVSPVTREALSSVTSGMGGRGALPVMTASIMAESPSLPDLREVPGLPSSSSASGGSFSLPAFSLSTSSSRYLLSESGGGAVPEH